MSRKSNLRFSMRPSKLHPDHLTPSELALNRPPLRAEGRASVELLNLVQVEIIEAMRWIDGR